MPEHPQFEIYPLMEDADPNQPTGQFGWRHRAAAHPEGEGDGTITAISPRTFDDPDAAERDIVDLMDALLAPAFEVGAEPDVGVFSDPATGVRWAVAQVEA